MRFAWALVMAAGILAMGQTALRTGAPTTAPAGRWRTFQTPYYVLHTDLDDDAAREAWVRVTRMFEAYKRRTAGFSGEISSKFPFYMYRDKKDYIAAGGMKDSAGIYKWDSATGGKLMVIAGDEPGPGTWHVVQHEGFHQFAHAVIGGDLPTWVNEGLAEYFGEGVFTGDEMVTGLILPARLKRVQEEIRDKDFMPLDKFMAVTPKEWSDKLTGANYDQAWSMVHFLAHGDNGKYQKALVAYMKAVARGRASTEAWVEVFGKDVVGFQKKWEEWWAAQEPSATAELYRKAVVLIFSSYLARAATQGQTFANAEEFFAAAGEGKLKMSKDEWLPPALLAHALELKPRTGIFSLIGKGAEGIKLTCELPDGGKITGAFVLSGGRVRSVSADVQSAATKPGK